MPGLVERLAAREHQDSSTNWAASLANARKEAEMAEAEVQAGFPLLHAQATVGLWTLLEGTVREFAVGFIKNSPNAMLIPEIAKLKVNLGEYESLDADDRCHHIADLLDRELGAPLKGGVSRLQALLKPFSVFGKVEEDQRKLLYELHQVRNALVHRSGVTDRKLQQECPWLDLKLGDQIVINHEKFNAYSLAVANYVVSVIDSIDALFSSTTGAT